MLVIPEVQDAAAAAESLVESLINKSTRHASDEV